MKSSLRDNFCSSPWFHLRINHAGYYMPCRWSPLLQKSNNHISDTSLSEYMNSFEMQNIRSDLLSGKPLDICKSCYYEDQHNKVSGRRKQLLKSAIDVENFNKTLCASPHWEMFAYSNTHQGYTNQQPVDLQIDIGNSCNSACIMCKPLHSSRLGQDYKKLHTIEPILFDAPVKFQNWTDDDKLVEKFINEITTEEIELLALDIEGIDAEVLLDINFNNLKLKYISFEHIHLGIYKENVLNHLKNNNYEFIGLGVDTNGFDYLYINGRFK